MRDAIRSAITVSILAPSVLLMLLHEVTRDRQSQRLRGKVQGRRIHEQGNI